MPAILLGARPAGALPPPLPLPLLASDAREFIGSSPRTAARNTSDGGSGAPDECLSDTGSFDTDNESDSASQSYVTEDDDEDGVLSCSDEESERSSDHFAPWLERVRFRLLPAHSLYNMLNAGMRKLHASNQNYLLLIDARSEAAGAPDACRIFGACTPSQCPRTGCWEYGRTDPSAVTFVVVYDERGSRSRPSDTALSLMRSLLADHSVRNGIYFLNGGWRRFHRRYPFMCAPACADAGASVGAPYEPPPPFGFPTEVIQGQLYIGNFQHAASRAIIDGLRITHIVNVSVQHENVFRDSIEYLHIAVDDVQSAKLMRYFQTMCDFTDRALASAAPVANGPPFPNTTKRRASRGAGSYLVRLLKKRAQTRHRAGQPDGPLPLSTSAPNVYQTDAASVVRAAVASGTPAACSRGAVLVHCTMGISRSATVCMAYLMHCHRWTVQQAYEYLRRRRPGVRPNPAFQEQLLAWEEHLLGGRYSDINTLFL